MVPVYSGFCVSNSTMWFMYIWEQETNCRPKQECIQFHQAQGFRSELIFHLFIRSHSEDQYGQMRHDLIRSHHFTESWIRCWHQLQQLNHVIYFVVILSAFTHNSLYCLLGIWKVRKPKKRFQIWGKCSYSLKNERGPNKAFPRCFLLVKLKLVWSNIIFFACTQNQIFRFRLYQDIICTVS